MPAYTSDTIALGIIAEGRRARTDGPAYLRHPAMTERGIVIALATGLVESNLTMYANESDPDSLRFPHDAISYDANSSGVFQQRAPWWGTAADRMDVARSAAMFYNHLATLDYNGPDSPGSYAQAVQRSAFPDRYDERMAEARAIYARLAGVPAAATPGATTTPHVAISKPDYVEIEAWGRGYSSRSRPPINFLIHTQEGNGDAQSLARFCDGSNNVSYHYTLRDGILCDVVDTDYYSWSVLDANAFTINLCFAGSFVSWSRQEWLQREHDIEIAAFIAVQDATKYGFSTEVIVPPYHQSPGISDHKYVTECLGIGTHSDVGNNFPWDVFAKYVNKYSSPNSVNPDTTGDIGMDNDRLPSRSPLRHLGEGLIDNATGMLLNIDGNLHVLLVKTLAEIGDTPALELLAEVAGADLTRFPDRAADAELARKILADIEATRPHIIQSYLAQKGQ